MNLCRLQSKKIFFQCSISYFSVLQLNIINRCDTISFLWICVACDTVLCIMLEKISKCDTISYINAIHIQSYRYAVCKHVAQGNFIYFNIKNSTQFLSVSTGCHDIPYRTWSATARAGHLLFYGRWLIITKTTLSCKNRTCPALTTAFEKARGSVGLGLSIISGFFSVILF